MYEWPVFWEEDRQEESEEQDHVFSILENQGVCDSSLPKISFNIMLKIF